MPETITKDTNASSNSPSKKFSKKVVFLGLGIVSVLFIITALLLSGSGKNSSVTDKNSGQSGGLEQTGVDPNQESIGSNKIASASNTLVYGAWKGEQSVIKSVDLLSNKSTLVATLPLSIKRVSVLSASRLLYIGETDKRDHGKQIVTYDIKEKKGQVVAAADPGFGIDDYVISPDKKQLAVWEVSFAKDSEIFRGGRSRVYSIDLTNPTRKQRLFDETANTPVHYPQAILNNGKVFADKFLPNDENGGAGWAYGMTVINSDGTDKKELSQMRAGTYGTQPFLAPDGKSLVFAGYDGSKGDGTEVVSGYRRAILFPNTVETLDVSTLKRQKLPNLPNSNVYSTVDWGYSSNELIITRLSQTEGQSGLFSYNVANNTLREINLPEDEQNPYSYVSTLSGNGLMFGKVDPSPTSVGNLGDGYVASLTHLYVQKSGSAQAQLLGLEDVFVQRIAVLPSGYFSGVLAATTAIEDKSFNPQPTLIEKPSDQYTGSRENLQLRTFNLPKQELTEVRKKQQSAPVTPTPKPNEPKKTKTFMESCTDLAYAQCGVKPNASPSRADYDCISTNKDKNRATRNTPEAVCERSPLYLYGENGQVVNVEIMTSVYNDIPKYNNGYNVRLGSGGNMFINGALYNAINYDYRSNLRVLRVPTKGTVASKSGLAKVIRDYGMKLGLNTKETNDLVTFGKENIKSPYVFISFFDQATSEQILPLSFNPKPDNYLNVVFYFKQLSGKPNYTPVPPIFGKPLDRAGFTAVEVSEMVE